MTYTITKEFSFDAGHRLRGLPDGHKCGRWHGHTYRVRVELTGDLDLHGFVLDYGELAPFKRWIDNTVDHQNLNELPSFSDDDPEAYNPTAENLSRYLTTVLHQVVDLPRAVFAQVWVSETPKTWASWNP